MQLIRSVCHCVVVIVALFVPAGSHVRQDSMEPSDFWDDVSNCRCGDRLMTLEQRANRQHQRCLAHSLVGTPNYIAPEVLLRKGGGKSEGMKQLNNVLNEVYFE